MFRRTALLLRNVEARDPFSSAFVCLCARVRVCQCVSLCVSIDARRVESGDGAVARRYASGRSAVSVLPQEASKSRREKI